MPFLVGHCLWSIERESCDRRGSFGAGWRAMDSKGLRDATNAFSADGEAGRRPLVKANRTASSSNSFVKAFCLVIEFTFHLRETLHFIGAST